MAGITFSFIPRLLFGVKANEFLHELQRIKWQPTSDEADRYILQGSTMNENFLGKWTVKTEIVVQKNSFVIGAIHQNLNMKPEDKVSNPIEPSAQALRRLGADYFEKRNRKWKEETFCVTESLTLSSVIIDC